MAQTKLGIQTGRFRNSDVYERICEVCNVNLLEDGFHFICICNAYSLSFTEMVNYKINSSQMRESNQYICMANWNLGHGNR